MDATPRPLYSRKRDKLPIVQDDWLVPESNAPINTTQKIVIQYILIFTFMDSKLDDKDSVPNCSRDSPSLIRF